MANQARRSTEVSGGLAAPATAARMAAAARALRAAVTGEQAPVLNPGFDDFDLSSPRRQWTYLPEASRPGLPLRALTDGQTPARLVPRIGEVELPDHVFEPEPDYRITDAERSALGYVRSGRAEAH
jgi:hypothetical protein